MKAVRYAVILAIGICFLIGFNAHPVAAEEIAVVSRGEMFTLTATLYTNTTSGIPLSNQVVYFFDQSHNELISSAITDDEGTASIEHSFDYNHPLGPTLINITFTGNESLSLAPVCQWLTLLVTSSTSIQTTITDTEFAPNDYLNLSITLIDDVGNPINNADVSFLCDSRLIASGNTNEVGFLQFDLALDLENFSLGFHKMDIVYSGDQIRCYRGTTTTFTISLTQLATTLELVNTSTSPIMLDQIWNGSVQLITSNEIVSSSPIDIFLDDMYLDTIDTDLLGFAEIDLHINQSFTIGSHTLTFQYQGTERYQSSIVHIPINVGSPIDIMAIPLDSAEIGNILTLRITALDLYSRPLPYGFVSITDSYSSNNITTVISNVESFDIQYPIQGIHGPRSLLIHITDDELLTNNSLYVTIDVYSRPQIEVMKSNILGYAYPTQRLSLTSRFYDYRGNLSGRTIIYSIGNISEDLSMFTGIDGIITIEIESPETEGSYALLFSYEGNISNYELQCSQTYFFQVSRNIPVNVLLEKYEIVAPLSTINVALRLQSLNGTYPNNVALHYQWLTLDSSSKSNSNGYISLVLPIPSSPGVYSLVYSIPNVNGLLAQSGAIYIIITSSDANAAEGIGLNGVLIGFASSISLFCIPLLRRRLVVS